MKAEFVPPTNSVKKIKWFKLDLEFIQKQWGSRQDDINLISVLNFKRTKTLKNESRGKLLEEIRKREDVRIEKENNWVIAIYNRTMSFEGKVLEDFKSLIVAIYKFGFGEEKKKTNYLK